MMQSLPFVNEGQKASKFDVHAFHLFNKKHLISGNIAQRVWDSWRLKPEGRTAVLVKESLSAVGQTPIMVVPGRRHP